MDLRHPAAVAPTPRTAAGVVMPRGAGESWRIGVARGNRRDRPGFRAVLSRWPPVLVV